MTWWAIYAWTRLHGASRDPLLCEHALPRHRCEVLGHEQEVHELK